MVVAADGLPPLNEEKMLPLRWSRSVGFVYGDERERVS